ncbi:MAG: ATP-binding cassette domain-containing protein [bacterium]|nr:ATP-binding cassette domain-containing protein [bacterium]
MTSILPLTIQDVGFAVAGRALLAGIDARFEATGRSIIIGPNGAGKSLLLRIAHGLVEPTSGRVAWRSEVSPRAHAMVFERPVLLRRSARANVEYALTCRGVDRASASTRADEALERTGLLDLAERNARVLSSGEQQRLALARAWAVEPQVLFLDEPTGALDPSATRAVEEIIGAIAEAGTKVIMITHDMGQARRLADEVLFLNKGRLIERAPCARFFDTPESDDARAFVGGELLW